MCRHRLSGFTHRSLRALFLDFQIKLEQCRGGTRGTQPQGPRKKGDPEDPEDPEDP